MGIVTSKSIPPKLLEGAMAEAPRRLDFCARIVV